ncbi:MAG: TVP38/TMEM64 family protein [Clostridia bacterium]|nr:TVP38/TMEM64 family protein [Clostridia bacterium]MBQ8333009.1 TVP38/TMEM64 family protein [Clostridia bacterium]MBQ8370538.1 TVP38/TMEM64 family protein [Clostridia bacterium]MBQ8513207.1 TVP38/TMEM64 family protein [Clostridia bacterium]
MKLHSKRIIAVTMLIVYLILCALIFVKIGKPFVSMLDEPGRFQEWIASHGIWGYAVFFLMTVLQVFVAVIPGEPFEIAAGYAFGWLGGTLITVAGVTLGQTLVFLLIRKYGMRALELFVPRDKLEKVNFIRTSGRTFRLLFALFLIPGTPKDILAYYAGLTNIRLSSFLIIAILARLPSVVTSTVGGSALSDGSYLAAAVVFLITTAVSVAGLVIYGKIQKSVTAKKGEA